MYMADLQVSGDCIAVGWLDRNHPFPQRKVSADFLAKLKEFSRRYGDSSKALGWGAMGGCHSCDFCGKAVGFGRFGVPAGDKLYCAPDLVAHYIEQHDYDPPGEFITAVMAAPSPGTDAYTDAVKRFRKW
jgi:hypothetical protein